MLTRMRQLVLHPGLVPRNYIDSLRVLGTDDHDKTAPPMIITPADRIRLQDRLLIAIEECEECPICFGILSEPRITSCAHVFCRPWYVDAQCLQGNDGY